MSALEQAADKREMVRLAIPLAPPLEYFLITGPWPLTEAEWDQMMRTIHVMQPALTAAEEEKGVP